MLEYDGRHIQFLDCPLCAYEFSPDMSWVDHFDKEHDPPDVPALVDAGPVVVSVSTDAPEFVRVS